MSVKSILRDLAKTRAKIKEVHAVLDTAAAVGQEAGNLAERVHGEVRETLGAAVTLGRVAANFAGRARRGAQSLAAAAKANGREAPEPPLKIRVTATRSR
jgi:hypothetical protein